MNYAPIALFGYNRPEHLKKTLDALSKNHNKNNYVLHIFLDGPKSQDEVDKINEVYAVSKEVIGFKKVIIKKMERNRGLSASIINGVGELCGKYGRVIVLEDDLITSQYFLEYMNTALELYENESRVAQISGYMFDISLDIDRDACFFPITNSWGWGTWGRAWKNFDAHMKGYDELKNNKSKKYKFNLDGNFDYFDMLERQKRGEIDSWAIRWYLTVFIRNEITLFPKKTLVQNIGFDGTGRHCDATANYDVEIEGDYRPTVFPSSVVECTEFNKLKRWFGRQNSLFSRVLRKLS